jgi:predicted metal-binding membrane protein
MSDMSMNVSARLLMWAVMMIGMMLPTAIPMTLIYAAVVRKARAQDNPLPPTFVFVASYVAVWIGFSFAATASQWGLERAALLSPMMASKSAVLGGVILLAAGVYQLTPLKRACLENCRAPAYFFSKHWRGGSTGAVRLGLRYGVYCLGCCWVLMALLFVGGVMNLVWIAGIAAFVLVEKTVPHGQIVGRFAGAAMLVVGAASIAGLLTLG